MISNHIKAIALWLVAMLPMAASAQPATVKKAAQSVFTLTTFSADGSIQGSSRGVFTGRAGEAVAAWQPFLGAARAVVVDTRGRQYDVDAMLGASELYGVCRFRVKGCQAPTLPTVTADAPANDVYMVDYNVKKPQAKQLKPVRTEKFMTTYNYYVFNDNDVSSTDLGCPLVNAAGQLVGIMQRPADGGQAFSADARLTAGFKTSGLSLNDPVLRATGIRAALPDDEKDALLMLMMGASGADSARYDAYISDFIAAFPTSDDGYSARAGRLTARHDYRAADAVLQEALKRVAARDEALGDYAKHVYQYALMPTDSTFTQWTLKRAEELAVEAYKVKPLPAYRHQQALALYAQGQYEKALGLFTELQQTEMGKNGEVYFEAAQCKTRLKAPDAEVMQLLDQAVAAQPGAASAPYVLARGRAFDAIGQTRKAFQDYMRYDSLVAGRGTHDFYYTKFKCEMKLRQYQPALQDIAHAIVLNRLEPTYYAEMANAQLRVGMAEDAVKTCDMALQITDQYADIYIIKGVALCNIKQKATGLECFAKAKALGDPRADDMVKKYQ